MNSTELQWLGYRDEELLNKIKFSDLLGAASRQTYRNAISSLKASGRHQEAELELIRKDGSRFSALFNATLETDLTSETSSIRCIVVDITEQKRLENKSAELTRAPKDRGLELEESNRQLQIKNEEAVKASMAKTEFLTNVSHEIRTPMNGVLGMADLLMKTELSDRQKKYTRMIKDSASSLLQVINSVLDIGKIEAGRFTLHNEEFSLIRVLDGVAELLSPKAQKKGIAISVLTAPNMPPMLYGDHGRLRQILINLAGNAVKYSERGEIIISASVEMQDADSARIHFSVSDQGIGITEEQISQIFEPFVNFEQPGPSELASSGLGLSICKKLVELMGGEIGARSEAGNGSVFWFSVPFTIVSKNRHGNDTEFTLLDSCHPSPESNKNKVSEQPAVGERSATLAKKRELILIAEDHLINQEVAAHFLEELGYETHIATDGVEVLAKLRLYPYTLLLMDCRMPKMNGLETTAAIREMEKSTGKRLPIIAMTANAIEEQREACLSAGMDDFLSKPIEEKTLAAMVAKWLPSGGSLPVATHTGSFDEITDSLDFERLEKTYGPEKFLHLCRLFLEDAGKEIERLRSSLNNRDHEAILESTHGLKGISGFLSSHKLIYLCREIDAATELNDWVRTNELFDVVEKIYASMHKRIIEFQSSN